MFRKILCFSLLLFANSLALKIDFPSGLNKLEELTNNCVAEIEKTSRNIRDASQKYNEIAKDRYECILSVYQTIKNGISDTIGKAVAQGLQKNKPVSSYECISNAASELIKKLDTIHFSIPNNYENIRDKHLEKVHPLNLVVSGFRNFTKIFYEKKRSELLGSKTEDVRKKILEEVEVKMKQITTVVGQISENINKSKFIFFEEFVNYVHKTENNMNKINREGNQKIMFCVF